MTMADDLPPDLKLVALDGEDLAVVSAHVQDSVLKVGDIVWSPKQARFALAMNRFAWEASATGRRKTFVRRRAALHFDRVQSVQVAHIRRDQPEAVLELLAVGFEETDPPAGLVVLYFAGGGAIRLAVECLEAQLADLGAAWQTSAMPTHDLSDPPESTPASD